MVIGVFVEKNLSQAMINKSILKKTGEIPLSEICWDNIKKTSQVGVLLKEKNYYNKKLLSKVEFQITEGQTPVAIHKQNKPDLGVTFEDNDALGFRFYIFPKSLLLSV